jgi:hypothetical protein
MFIELKLGPQWNYEVPHNFGIQYHLQKPQIQNTQEKIWLF